MRKFFTLVALVVSAVAAVAQVPAFMNYSCSIKGSDGVALADKNVSIRVSVAIASNVYVETHSAKTDANGLVDIVIGKGKSPFDAKIKSLGKLKWSQEGVRKLKVEIDPEGGTNYTISGESEIGSVPFSFYSDYANKAMQVGDMPMANVTVAIDGLGSAPQGWVEILGQRVDATNPSVTVSVPAYSPVYMSWNNFKSDDNIKVNSVYLNGVGVNKNVGTVDVEGTVTKRELVYLRLKATDWALVSEQYTTSKGKLDYGRFDESVITKNWEANPSKFTSMTADEYNTMFNQSTYLNNDGDMNFTHPTDTRLTASNSYIGVNFWTYISKPGTVTKNVKSKAFDDGNNFPIGPFDPNKENKIVVQFVEIIF
ncbi:MAG: hypothetical protein MJZ15_08090 [Bacteroidales bacterium]|nr:hypothetical protein [Bacteroidales bacterium]